MSDNDDLLGDDLGDHSLADYNLGNEEEEQLLADDYESSSSQNVPMSVGPEYRSTEIVSASYSSHTIQYSTPQTIPYQPPVDTECVVPNITVEVPNTPLSEHSTYAPYEPPVYEAEHAVVPPAIPAAPLESAQIVPTDMPITIPMGAHQVAVTKRSVPFRSADAVAIPRGPYAWGRGRSHAHAQGHPYRRVARGNYHQRQSFPPPQLRPSPPIVRPDSRPEIRPNFPPEFRPSFIPEMQPMCPEVGPDIRPNGPDVRERPDFRPELRMELRPDIRTDLPPDMRSDMPAELRPLPDMRSDIHPDLRPDIRLDVRPDVRPNIRMDHLHIHPDMRREIRPDLRPEIRPDLRPAIRPDVRPDIHPDLRPEIRPDLRPEIRSKSPDLPFRPENRFLPNGPRFQNFRTDEERPFGPRPLYNYPRPNFNPRFAPPIREISPNNISHMPQVTIRQPLPKLDEKFLPSLKPREQEVIMLPVQLPANLPPGGLAGKKVLINPHFKGNFQSPAEGPVKDIDDAAERFIAEQRNALARAANRKFLPRRSPQRF
ncbi:hypothetical protein ACJJTC_007294 [Scirpophaga incertulas]